MAKKKIKKVIQKVKPKKSIRKIIIKNIPSTINEEQNHFIETSAQMEIPVIETPEKTETIISNPVSTQEIKTLNSDSMLNDLMGETDKDSEPVNENIDSGDDLLNDIQTEEKISEKTDSSLPPNTESTIGDKIHDTLTTEGEDWQNPSDFRKMCAVNAMMYVEGGAILLSFIGQMISGDWTSEGEKRYYPSEERRKIIRAPLAKKLELNKDHSKTTPTGALITAIIFTVLPIIIIAFKDRKARIEAEAKNIENAKLRKELEATHLEIERLKASGEIPLTNNVQQRQTPITPFLIKKRGRHKTDCDCEKCNLKRMSSKKRK